MLIAAGLAGVTLATFGAPVPLLASLLLVGLGADADLGRRFSLAKATDPAATEAEGYAAGLRAMHAGLYAVLVTVAWAALYDASSVPNPEAPTRTMLTLDLFTCAALLAARLTRLR